MSLVSNTSGTKGFLWETVLNIMQYLSLQYLWWFHKTPCNQSLTKCFDYQIHVSLIKNIIAGIE